MPNDSANFRTVTDLREAPDDHPTSVVLNLVQAVGAARNLDAARRDAAHAIFRFGPDNGTLVRVIGMSVLRQIKQHERATQ